MPVARFRLRVAHSHSRQERYPLRARGPHHRGRAYVVAPVMTGAGLEPGIARIIGVRPLGRTPSNRRGGHGVGIPLSCRATTTGLPGGVAVVEAPTRIKLSQFDSLNKD